LPTIAKGSLLVLVLLLVAVVAGAFVVGRRRPVISGRAVGNLIHSVLCAGVNS
jgi:hypothetical protein